METSLNNTWESRALTATERKEPQPVNRIKRPTGDEASPPRADTAMGIAGISREDVLKLTAKFKPGVKAADKSGSQATQLGQVLSVWIEVTPEMARRWLTTNFRNRPMSDEIVAAYARDMAAGRWQATHQGIGFNDLDQLIDGQHRLAAVVKFGKPVRMMVTFGLPAKIAGTEMTTMDCVDRGRTRSVADQLKIQHGLKNGTHIAQVSAALAHLCFGERLRRLSVGQTLDIYRAFQPGVDFVIASRSKDQGLRSAGVLAAFAFVQPLEPQPVVKFFTALNSGREIERYPALKLLREFLTGEQASLILASINRGIAELVVQVIGSELQQLKPRALEMQPEKWLAAVEQFRARQPERVAKVAGLFKLPGAQMKITQAQRWKILKLWTSVCQDRKWKSSDRALRLQTLGGLIGRELTTLDDLGRIDECNKVLHELNAMLGTSVQSAREAEDNTINRARTLRHKIRYEVLPCLALYVDDPIGFMRGIMEDKNRWWKIDRPAVEMTLDDLDAKPIVRTVKGEPREFPSTLEQLLYTLSARLNDKRKLTPDTIHDMKLKAGVECDCAPCMRARGQLVPSLKTQEVEARTV